MLSPDIDANPHRCLQREGDQASDLVATENQRGEAACDDREKEGSSDGVLHRRSPGAVGPAFLGEG